MRRNALLLDSSSKSSLSRQRKVSWTAAAAFPAGRASTSTASTDPQRRALRNPDSEQVPVVSGTAHRVSRSRRKRTGAGEQRPPTDGCGTPRRPTVVATDSAAAPVGAAGLENAATIGSPKLYDVPFDDCSTAPAFHLKQSSFSGKSFRFVVVVINVSKLPEPEQSSSSSSSSAFVVRVLHDEYIFLTYTDILDFSM